MIPSVIYGMCLVPMPQYVNPLLSRPATMQTSGLAGVILAIFCRSFARGDVGGSTAAADGAAGLYQKDGVLHNARPAR